MERIRLFLAFQYLAILSIIYPSLPRKVAKMYSNEEARTINERIAALHDHRFDDSPD